MDLLAGYGSGSDDERDSPSQSTRNNVSIPDVSANAGIAVVESSKATAAKPSLFASLPGPRSAAPVVSSRQNASNRVKAPADLPPGFFDSPAEAPATSSKCPPAGIPTDFFDAAPPARADAEAEQADEADVGPALRPPHAVPEDLPAPTDTALWSTLPAPTTAAGKRKVLFRPKINLELLAASDSDDDDAPTAKKFKPAAGAAGKPSILSFLPAPKHAPEGPKGSGMRLVTGKQQERAGLSGNAAAAAQTQYEDSDGAEGQRAAVGPVMYSNEQYRLVEPAAAATGVGYGAQGGSSYDYQQQYSAQQYEQYYSSTEGAGAYDYSAYGYEASTAAAAAAAAATGGGGSDYLPPEEALLQEALQAEAAKAARRNAGAGSSQLMLPDIQFKEVQADKIKYVDPSQREAAQGMRAALGTEYAAKLRAEAAPHVGSRLARSKHQIGTLFANAKLRELEILENRAAGMKSKSETAGKYGWR